ncbi:MAG: DUF11 domain-containing protein [Chloroflexi bacterium]|nr:DUF11 domain-containing protein [Chloroflexota bacterium]
MLRKVLPSIAIVLLFVCNSTMVGATTGPNVVMSKTASPGTVPSGGIVTYEITLTNSGDQSAIGVTVVDTLPVGFIYRPGSASLISNGTVIGHPNPSISGRNLTWSNLTVPSARTTSHYGIHTFVHDRCERNYIKYQLDKALQLAGPNSYVKQLFYWITPQTTGPQSCWVDFVNEAYNRNLIPIVRLQGTHGGPYWNKPEPDAPGDYTSIAQAYRRVVEGLPRRESRPLYIEIWNEPNLDIEWSGRPDPVEYAEFLVDVAAAIRAIGDPRIRILNGALSPGGNYNNLAFIDGMATVPGAMQAFDLWASHPYPGNHPPEYNIHDGTATYIDATIDSYKLELDRLAAHGRTNVQVLLTETGYALGQNNFGFEGYPPIGEENRADYIKRALGDYWARWPEVLGVCPYELVDPKGDWWMWDFVYRDGTHHWQYDSVAALDKTPVTAPGTLCIRFQATAVGSGMYYNSVSATASNAIIAPLTNVAPINVVAPTVTRTPTRTRTPTSTPTVPATTPTGSPTPSLTFTLEPVLTPPTPTETGTPTPTTTASATPTATLTNTPVLLTPTPTPSPGCRDLIVNGDFETDTGWYIPNTAYPAGYSTTQAHSPVRSMRLGIESGTNIYSHSSAKQTITIPSDASSATLRFWYYPVSGDIANDWQAALVTNEYGAVLDSVLWVRSDARTWIPVTYSLNAYLGQTIRVHFEVKNDGAGGLTCMYVDDVSVEVCSPQPTPTPTTTATPSPTPSPSNSPGPSATPTQTSTTALIPTLTMTSTPLPTFTCTPTIAATVTPAPNCTEAIQNGGFEEDIGWYLIPTAYTSGYSATQVRSGQRALRCGIESGTNVLSYSDARQTITIPSGVTRATLSFWYYPRSDDTSHDRQYAFIRHSGGNSYIFWVGSNTQEWIYHSHDLTGFAGQSITIQFGVYNDGNGGLTVMYVDDVSVEVCTGVTPTPNPTVITGPYASRLPIALREYVPNELAASMVSEFPAQGIFGQGALSDVSSIAIADDTAYLAGPSGLLTLDRRTGQVGGRLGGGSDIRGLAVDPERKRLYVAGWDENSVAVIDTQSGRVLYVVKDIPGPGGIALAGEHVFIASTANDALIMLSAETYGIIETISTGDAPYAVVCEEGTNRVFVANAGEDSVTVIDSTKGEAIATIRLGGLGHPQGLALDVELGRLYVTYALTPKLGALAAIDVTTNEVVARREGTYEMPLLWAYGVAVDPVSHMVYVTDVAGLIALDGRDLTPKKVIAGAGMADVFGLTVDGASGLVYAADRMTGQLLVYPGR